MQWLDTAAQHPRNEAYWRVRALKAEGATLSPDDEVLLEVMNKLPAITHEGDQTIDVGVRDALIASQLARAKVAFLAFGEELSAHLPAGHSDDWDTLPMYEKKMWVRIAQAVISSLTPGET